MATQSLIPPNINYGKLSADEYDPNATYSSGDLRIHDNILHKANQDISVAEPWTPAHWDATTIAAELKAQAEDISDLNSSFVSVANNLQNGWEANGECGYVKMGNALFLQVSVRRGATTLGTVIATGFPDGYSAVIPNSNAGSSLGAVRLMNGQLDILLDLENSNYLFINGVALK